MLVKELPLGQEYISLLNQFAKNHTFLTTSVFSDASVPVYLNRITMSYGMLKKEASCITLLISANNSMFLHTLNNKDWVVEDIKYTKSKTIKLYEKTRINTEIYHTVMKDLKYYLRLLYSA